MSDDENEESYSAATDEQKLSIATYFIMSSPVGEVDFVVADTKRLVGNDEILSPETISGILKDYNLEQYTSAYVPGEDNKKTLVCSHGQVSDVEYVYPNTGEILNFDHITREFTSKSDKKQEQSAYEGYRAAIEKSLAGYLDNTYKGNKATTAVYCTPDSSSEPGRINIVISASNTKISAYWTGGWVSNWAINVSNSGETVDLEGDIKIHVHYFEDGNVQLHSAINKKIPVEIKKDTAATASKIVNVIKIVEKNYQKELEDMYVNMHRVTFKEMRRFLPINRKPMEWNIYKHGVGVTKS